MPSAEYVPSNAELYALDHVRRLFDGSKAYYYNKHKRMKRIYAKYMNVAVRGARPTGFSDERLGMVYRAAEILHAVLSKPIMKQSPIGKIHAEGDEDFAGKQAIDRIHSKQQRETRIYNALDTAIWYSVITGTGFIMPGWDHHTERLIQKTAKTMQLANPADPFGLPLEIPTGEFEDIEFSVEISRIDAKIVQPWNVFPVAGATSMFGLHTLTYRVPVTRKELYTMQRSGELENVDKIDFDAAAGVDQPDEYIDETDVYKAKREDTDTQQDKETVWLLYSYTNFPYFNFEEHLGQEDIKRDDEYDCLIVKPQHDDVILKLKMTGMDVQCKPGVPFKYGGPDDMFFGISPLEIAEQLIQLQEDMFNWTMDRAKREVYQKIGIVEGVDQGALSQSHLEGIVTIPKELGMNAQQAILPITIGPSLMPNLMKNEEKVYGIIDEVTGVLDFVRGAAGDPDETATKTIQRTEFIGTRFGKRIDYFEHNGLWWWMQWQTVLNVMFLDAMTMERITGYPANANPFKLIRPTIPMESYDFSFEASSKAVDDPVKAQILRGVLEMASKIGPGKDEKGNLVVANSMQIFRDFLRKVDVTDDLESYFIKLQSPDEIAMFMQAKGGGQGGGPVPLGATEPGQLAPLIAGLNQKQDVTPR